VDHGQFDRFEAQQLDGPDYFKKEVRTAAQMTYPELKRYINGSKTVRVRRQHVDGRPLSKTVLSAGVVYHGHHRHSIFSYDRIRQAKKARST